MMAEEKAQELRELFFNKCNVTIAGTYTIFRELSKDIAITAVDEILNTIEKYVPYEGGGRALIINPNINYWERVKEAINKL